MVHPVLPLKFFKDIPEPVDEVWGVDPYSAKRFQAFRLLLEDRLARVSLQNRVDG